MANVLGWIGAVLVLGAYGLVATGVLKPQARVWAALNIVGSAALAWSAALDRRWPFVVLNTVWCFIALWSFVRPPKERGGPTSTSIA